MWGHDGADAATATASSCLLSGVMGPMPGGGINSPSSVSDLLSLRMPCSQPISQDGTGQSLSRFDLMSSGSTIQAPAYRG